MASGDLLAFLGGFAEAGNKQYERIAKQKEKAQELAMAFALEKEKVKYNNWAENDKRYQIAKSLTNAPGAQGVAVLAELYPSMAKSREGLKLLTDAWNQNQADPSSIIETLNPGPAPTFNVGDKSDFVSGHEKSLFSKLATKVTGREGLPSRVAYDGVLPDKLEENVKKAGGGNALTIKGRVIPVVFPEDDEKMDPVARSASQLVKYESMLSSMDKSDPEYGKVSEMVKSLRSKVAGDRLTVVNNVVDGQSVSTVVDLGDLPRGGDKGSVGKSYSEYVIGGRPSSMKTPNQPELNKWNDIFSAAYDDGSSDGLARLRRDGGLKEQSSEYRRIIGVLAGAEQGLAEHNPLFGQMPPGTRESVIRSAFDSSIETVDGKPVFNRSRFNATISELYGADVWKDSKTGKEYTYDEGSKKLIIKDFDLAKDTLEKAEPAEGSLTENQKVFMTKFGIPYTVEKVWVSYKLADGTNRVQNVSRDAAYAFYTNLLKKGETIVNKSEFKMSVNNPVRQKSPDTSTTSQNLPR